MLIFLWVHFLRTEAFVFSQWLDVISTNFKNKINIFYFQNELLYLSIKHTYTHTIKFCIYMYYN